MTVADAKKAVEDLNNEKTKEKIDSMVAAYQKEMAAIDNYRKKMLAFEAESTNAMGVRDDVSQNLLESQRAKLDEMVKHAQGSWTAIGKAYENIGEELLSITKYSDTAFTRPLPIKTALSPPENTETVVTTTAEAIKKTLSQKLSAIKLTPEQNYGENLKNFESFLKQRVELENVSGEERVKAIAAQEKLILENVRLTEKEKGALAAASSALQEETAKAAAAAAEKLAADAAQKKREDAQKEYDEFVKDKEAKLGIAQRYLALESEADSMDHERRLTDLTMRYGMEQALLAEQQEKLKEMTDIDNTLKMEEEERLNLAKLESDKRYADEKKKIDDDAAAAERERNQGRLSAASNLAGSMSQLIKAAAKDHAGAAAAAKVIDMAQAGINTAMAISGALSEPGVPTPLKWANAIAMGIAGAAQQATIMSTMIPGAETGGRFMVPDSFTGVDSALLRLNQGEIADITPRGESGEGYGTPLHVTVNLNGRPLIDFINDGIYSREINITAGLNV
jgi:hypothetical protein